MSPRLHSIIRQVRKLYWTSSKIHHRILYGSNLKALKPWWSELQENDVWPYDVSLQHLVTSSVKNLSRCLHLHPSTTISCELLFATNFSDEQCHRQPSTLGSSAVDTPTLEEVKQCNLKATNKTKYSKIISTFKTKAPDFQKDTLFYTLHQLLIPLGLGNFNKLCLDVQDTKESPWMEEPINGRFPQRSADWWD